MDGKAKIKMGKRAAEVELLKADLIGQCMGGREKCWQFQSLDQIKELAIKNKAEDSQKRLHTALQLHGEWGRRRQCWMTANRLEKR